jgi:hypothetical protein
VAFSLLDSRVTALPDVIVGPVLRLVLPGQVNVFFALSKAQKVTVEVFTSEAGLGKIMAGTRSTTKIADHLHVVCVTATGTQQLQPGDRYYYDAKFGPPGNDSTEAPSTRRLYTAGVLRDNADQARALLTYPGGPGLPSFVLPPAEISDFRLLHASCRKAHAEGKDALATGDEIVAASFTSLAKRPHQLYLTGDQIYADDVAMPLLFLLQDAASALGFPVEQLPLKAGAKPGSDLKPGARGKVLEDDAGFTSGEKDSHLMTFADFALMYAFAWSDALWPGAMQAPDDALTVHSDDLPQPSHVLKTEWDDYQAKEAAWLAAADPDAREPEPDKRFKQIISENKEVADYRSTLPKVRRLLANTPTLTIFDDHEITDDWNLNLAWEKRVYDPNAPADKPTALGRAVVRNGLAAYALFQAWGNTPAQFAAGVAPTPPGATLLAQIASWDGQPAAPEVAAINTCVGIPESFDGHIAVKPAGSLVWHYAHRWAQHELIVLDTRTERGAVSANEPDAPPALIYEDSAFSAMARPTPAPGADTLVIVVAPGPVFGVPLHEATGRYLHWPSVPFLSPHEKANPGMDPEHWALTPYAREHLLGALMTRPAPGADGVIRSRIVLLGGDVHHGSAVRVGYHATTAFRYPGSAVEGVVAQLTSSALKNQSGLTMKIEAVGFLTIDSLGNLVVPPLIPLTEVNGWDNPGGARKIVGTEQLTGSLSGVAGQRKIKVKHDPAIYEFSYGVPIASTPGATPSTAAGITYTLTTPPDWHYEVRPQRGVLVGRGTPASIAIGAADRDSKVTKVAAAALEHHRYKVDLGHALEVVGHNNIGDVSFAWGAGDDKTVVMDLWYRPDERVGNAAPFTRFVIALDNGSL